MSTMYDKLVGSSLTPVTYLFLNEGGYVVDQGGPTNFGITIPVLADYCKVDPSTLSAENIKAITAPYAEALYDAEFWNRFRINLIADPNIATCIFDTAVNRGPGTAIKYAQKVCTLLGHALVVDGSLGPATAGVINACDRATFIKYYEAMEMAGYEAIIASNPAKYEVDRDGWENRARKLLTLAVA